MVEPSVAIATVSEGESLLPSPEESMARGRPAPGRDFFTPARGVFAQAGSAEVDAFAAVLAEILLEGGAVGAGEGDSVLPQRRLGRTDIRGGFFARRKMENQRDQERYFIGAPSPQRAHTSNEVWNTRRQGGIAYALIKQL